MKRLTDRFLRVTPSGLLTIVLLGMIALPGFAQDVPTPPGGTDVERGTPEGGLFGGAALPSDPRPGIDLTRAVINTFVALLVVLALVIGLAYVLRRASGRMRRTGAGGILVLAQVPLGPSQFLSVVDVGGEVLVLGVTEHSVTALSEIEDPDLIVQLREERSTGRAPAVLQSFPSFRQWLSRAQHGELD